MEKKSKFKSFLNKHPSLKCILKNLFLFSFYKIYFPLTSPIRMFFRTIVSHDQYIEQSKIVREVHKETFKGYKNLYNGKEIVIFGSGPSLNKYKPIPGTICIGVNKTLINENLTLDYFFATDYIATKSYLDKLKFYKNKNLQIFMGVLPPNIYLLPEGKTSSIMPESKIIEFGAKKYYLLFKYPPYSSKFNTEIDKTWIIEGGSVIFAAMQFALFTNPKKIYLVGCDCSTGYFDENNKKIKPNKIIIKVWKKLKIFAQTYYPDTEIISVNPVGLKGIFKDLYQEDEK